MRYLLALIPLALVAADAPKPIAVKVPTRSEPVSYINEIADILGAKCVGCHSAALAESKLDMEEVAGMLKGGKRGPAIVPGKSDESLLFQLASHQAAPAMPPENKKGNELLTSEELGLIKLWIDSGAKDDSEDEAGPKSIELGTLPPGIQPIVAVDMTPNGERVAAGRANVVQVVDAASGLEIASLGGHKDIIQSLRFSPDGKRLAAGSYQVVTLWNLPSGGLNKTLEGHTDQVKALAVAPDGKTAYSASPDKSIRVWNLAEGKGVRQMTAPAPVNAIAVKADGTLLAAGGQDNLIHLLNVADGKLLATLKGHTGPVLNLAFTPDGQRLASTSADGSARIWTVPSDTDLREAKAPDQVKAANPLTLSGHKGAVSALAITPDGQTLITGGDDATVRLWNLSDGAPARTIEGHSAPVLALAVSPDGHSLLSGSADKLARLFDLAKGTQRTVLTGHLAPVRAVGFAPKGDQVVTAGEEGGLKVWDSTSGQGVIAFGHSAPANAAIQALQKVAFTAEGALISASADKTLKTWTFEGGWSEMKPLAPHVFRVLAIDFSPDGKLLATGGGDPSRSGEVKIWNVETGELVRTLDSLHSDTVFTVRFSPDGSKLATGAADKFLKVTNVTDGKLLKSFEGHTHHVLAVDWKSDGKVLVTGGADNVVKIWDFESGEQIMTLPALGKQVTAVHWLHDKSQVLGASGDHLVRIWNVNTNTQEGSGSQRRRRGGGGGVAVTFSGPSDYVYCVAASRDGKLVTAGGADSVLFIWNGQNGQVIRKIEARPSAPATAGAKTASANIQP